MEPINRKALKDNAKIALKGNFWMIMLVALVAGFLGAGFDGLGKGGINASAPSNFKSFSDKDTVRQMFKGFQDAVNDRVPGANFDFHYNDADSLENNLSEFVKAFKDSMHITDEELAQAVLIFVGIVMLICVIVWVVTTVISFLVGSFLSAPVTVGYNRFFMLNRKQEGKFGDLFSAFAKGKYMNIVKAMFSANIRNWAWSLLFFFPGLVSAYKNYFVSYIMAENPNISPVRARELSKQMTDGHKWQIFVLELSFLGWVMVFVLEEILLALISCGILAIPGALLIYPLIGYAQATYAELYEERREYALVSGMATSDELIGF